jgi:outer membrane receptor protein involved in Fe transport
MSPRAPDRAVIRLRIAASTAQSRGLVSATLAVACLASQAIAADRPTEVFELPSVQVVGTSPLPGFGTPLRDVPANVQIFDSRLFARTRPLTLTQFFDQNSNSVNASSGQGNAYQQSLDFRGFAASPLLGTPQGMSVFQDGVRVNEAFGDVVNWDMLPRSAIASVQLIPGSVPAFGLNTLGGALAIYTKRGAQYPGTAIELSGGAFGRRGVEFEYGHAGERFDAFATGNMSDTDGWAKHNASRVRQFFGNVGFQDAASDVHISVTLADNALNGAQTLPQSFMDKPREPYTYPDTNGNRLAFVVARGNRLLRDDQLVDANVYYRRYRNSNLSSNVDERFGDDDSDANPATNDRATIDAASFGAALQWTARGRVGGFAHQLAIGGSGNWGRTRFTQASQPATFTADRGTIGTGPYAQTTDVDLDNADAGLYVTDSITLNAAWVMTLAGRFNHARVEIADRTGDDAALNGTHAFSRFNPAIGVNYSPSASLTAYASYNQGMRAPTPIELTCADPSAPCKLPNQFLADPPLAKVLSSTLEAGARGQWGSARWSAAVYRTELRDDLAFIASGTGATNAGYFRNVGRTRRQGLELASTLRADPFTVAIRYNAVDARFRSGFAAASPANSEADGSGAIDVRPGNRMPGIPVHSAKLRVDWDASPDLGVAASVVAASSQYARGDENNADRSGRVPGYFVVNLDAEYRLTPRVTLFAQIENVLDRRYANFGLLGENVFTAPDRTFGPAAGVAPVAEQFRALGSPRGIFAGVRIAFDVPARR